MQHRYLITGLCIDSSSRVAFKPSVLLGPTFSQSNRPFTGLMGRSTKSIAVKATGENVVSSDGKEDVVQHEQTTRKKTSSAVVKIVEERRRSPRLATTSANVVLAIPLNESVNAKRIKRSNSEALNKDQHINIKSSSSLLAFEQKYWNKGCRFVVGVDEAGRGPLAGPVVVAGCALEEDCPDVDSSLIDDSKKLSERDRDTVFAQLINSKHVHYDIAIIDHTQIDEMNILRATLFGMDQVVTNLTKRSKCDAVLIDGPFKPPIAAVEQTHIDAIKGGDAKSRAIGAASVLAKVTRDRLMHEYHVQYPQYGFDRHKGYPVRDHVKALTDHGPCKIHRVSYGPVKRAIALAMLKKNKDD